MSAQWQFETTVEYHIAFPSAVPLPPTSPGRPKKKRASAIDIPQSSGSDFRTQPAPSPILPCSPTSRIPEFADDGPHRARRGSQQPTLKPVTSPNRRRCDPALRPSRSFAKLSSTTTSPRPLIFNGPERGLPNKWSGGRIHIALSGDGGRDGGELRISRNGVRKPALIHAIPPVHDDAGWTIPDIQHLHPSIAARSHVLALRLPAMEAIADPPQTPPPPVPRFPKEVSQTLHEGLASPPSTTSFLTSPNFLTRKVRQASETRFNIGGTIGSMIPGMSGTRSRSKTLSSPIKPNHSITPSPVDLGTPFDFSAPPPPLLEPNVAPPGIESESYLYLSFQSQRQLDEWFGIFRSLARLPSDSDSQRLARPHRRLKLSILDLQESQPQQAGLKSSLSPRDGSSSHQDGASVSSDNQSGGPRNLLPLPYINRSVDTETETKRVTNIKPGWSWKENIRVELILDGRLVARTSWAKAPEVGGNPFWGEQFSLVEVPPFSTCTLLLVRNKAERTPVIFGKVDLPLVPTFHKTEDERYPVRSLSGVVIGEIRLMAVFQEIDVLPMAEYETLQLGHADGTSKFLYVLGGRGLMEGTMEYLCRIAICEGVLMPRVMDTCTLEARSAGSTLFRSTTPLSKTLEVIMRMMCSEFLEAAIGPTIRNVVKDKLEPKLFCNYGDPNNPPLNYRILRIFTQLIETCWSNMYGNRNLFPNFIRHILAHLFRTVKEHHDEGNDESASGPDDQGTKSSLLRYKAVSSFVFLRLIGPALMTPHLFGLATSLPPPPQQRALTLIAKVLHTLAFFSDRELIRHPDLVLFQPFIKANSHAMIDFLTSLATPMGDLDSEPPAPTNVEKFIAERRAQVPRFQGEAIPRMTEAGPIDLGADWAVCSETWFENRRQPGLKLAVVSTIDITDIADLLTQYDEFLDRIHALSYPAQPSPELSGTSQMSIRDGLSGSERSYIPRSISETSHILQSRSPTPCPSRPSLNLSTSSTPTSEDSHSIIYANSRKLISFAHPSESPRAVTFEDYIARTPRVPRRDDSLRRSIDTGGRPINVLSPAAEEVDRDIGPFRVAHPVDGASPPTRKPAPLIDPPSRAASPERPRSPEAAVICDERVTSPAPITRDGDPVPSPPALASSLPESLSVFSSMAAPSAADPDPNPDLSPNPNLDSSADPNADADASAEAQVDAEGQVDAQAEVDADADTDADRTPVPHLQRSPTPHHDRTPTPHHPHCQSTATIKRTVRRKRRPTLPNLKILGWTSEPPPPLPPLPFTEHRPE